MNIHEYQAKEILGSFGIAVPRGRVALTSDQVERAAKEMGGRCIVKAQIYAGGRGKAGGVKLVHHPNRHRNWQRISSAESWLHLRPALRV